MFFKAKTLTAHAPCHVTCGQGVQNNHIFGIPKAILPIHYTTFMGLQWRLVAVFGRKFLSPFFAQFSTLGGFFRG